MIAHVAAATGWTWDYISEHVDLPRLAALNDYWSVHPPVHVMVAAYLGIGAETKPKEQDFSELFQNLPFQEGLNP